MHRRLEGGQVRTELLMQVDKAWEMSVPVEAPTVAVNDLTNRSDSSGVAYITRSCAASRSR